MLSFLFFGFIFLASFVLVLSFLVFIHELGHYSMGRLFGVAVERFSIGFGKPIVKWTAKSGTEWTISRIPLGGYVKFLGDAGAASNPDAERLEEIKSELSSKGHEADISDVYHFKPVWQRALIALAGPLANFILAIAIFSFIGMTFGLPNDESVVTGFAEESAARESGMQIGDLILTLNGSDVAKTDRLIAYVSVRSGVELQAVVDRGGEKLEMTVTPKRTTKTDFVGGKSEIGMIGVTTRRGELVQYGPIEAVGKGYGQFSNMITSTGTYIGRIFVGKEDGKAFGGPVRIATYVGKSTIDILKSDADASTKLRAVFLTLSTLAAAISVGLGVANLMPIPALDGGHLLYYGYEAVAGRPLSEQKQEFGFKIGLAIILSLFIYITINDIAWVSSIESSAP